MMLWVKDNWRFVASLAAIVVVFGFGYYKGYSHEHAKLQDHLNTDATLMAVAKAQNERQLATQREITTRVSKEHADEVAKLTDYYKSHPRIVRMCSEPAKTNTVLTKSESTSGTDQTSHRTTETIAPIEIDLERAGQEVLQCQALIAFEKEQDRVQ